MPYASLIIKIMRLTYTNYIIKRKACQILAFCCFFALFRYPPLINSQTGRDCLAVEKKAFLELGGRAIKIFLELLPLTVCR